LLVVICMPWGLAQGSDKPFEEFLRVCLGARKRGSRPGMTTPESHGPAGRRVTLENLGGWLLKGNADRADLSGRFAVQPRITCWCVRPGYRTRLMRAGQPVLFWGSGSRHREIVYGVWGLGRLSGPAERGQADGGRQVPLDLVIADPAGWVSRDDLRDDPVLADMEVLRQPQAANPSFVTVRQFEVIRRCLDDRAASEVEGGRVRTA
jgi:hypothetical protein